MANTQSAKKQIRQNEKHRIRNQAVRTRTRNMVKAARADLEAQNVEAAEATVGAATSALDRAVSKGVMHKNTASRSKSRLMKHLNALRAGEEAQDN